MSDLLVVGRDVTGDVGGRRLPEIVELDRRRWYWVAAVPWFPDLLSAPERSVLGNPVVEAFGRQLSLLRAVAALRTPGAALQLRFLSDGRGNVSCYFVGAGSDKESTTELVRLVAALLPYEYPLVPVEPRPGSEERIIDVLRAHLRAGFDTVTADNFVEIRRALEPLDPVEINDEAVSDVGILPFVWTTNALLPTLEILSTSTPCMIGVHIEPGGFSDADVFDLRDLASRARKLLDGGAAGSEGPREVRAPVAAAAFVAYTRWLRLLPQACLHLRLFVVGRPELPVGIGEALASDLTRSFERGGEAASVRASVVRPQAQADVLEARALVHQLISEPTELEDFPELSRLLRLFEPTEASVAFRLPVMPMGGLRGLATGHVSRLGAGTEIVDEADRTVVLGSDKQGRPFGLTPAEVNRHLLVAGLPGFGKSTTVKRLLSELWLRHRIPFLVIDPAKDDYDDLVDDLAASGAGRIIELMPGKVGLNPFTSEAPGDAAASAGRVLAAFDAVFQLTQVNPLGKMVLARALHRVMENSSERPATLNELYRTVGLLIRRGRFAAEVRSNLEGSLLARLDYLGSGPMGSTILGDGDSTPSWPTLLSQPCLISLRRFSGPDERALIFSLVVGSLIGHLEARTQWESAALRNVVVLEEAHRVLSARSEGTGVDVFVEAMAELRSRGTGFVVVDQAPTTLHPSVPKLVGTTLSHRLVDVDERSATGAGMLLEFDQRQELGHLTPGQALILTADRSTVQLVDVHLPVRLGAGPAVRSTALGDGVRAAPMFCSECPYICAAREVGERLSAEFTGIVETGVDTDQLYRRVGARVRARPRASDLPAAYCTTAHVLGARHRDEPAALRRSLDRLLVLDQSTRQNLGRKATT